MTCRIAIALSALLLWSSPALAAPWLTVTEISYRPAGEAPLEFIEIYNLEAPHVDLSAWRLEGEVDFVFPKGTKIAPRQCLVIAQDVAAFKKRYPSVSNVVGPFVGQLDNDGGRVVLRNRIGALSVDARYGRDGAWTAIPNGTGRTLVLSDALLDPRDARSWSASKDMGGSPGVFEKSMKRKPGIPIVSPGATWRFFRGKSKPDANWMKSSFDDSAWESGPSGFGYGDDDDATNLDDMRGRYVSVFTRRTFRVDDLAKLEDLALLVDYDDGFIAYLNGKEIARVNLVDSPAAVVWNESARGIREAGRPDVFSLGAAKSLLRSGSNVLAVAVFNSDVDSSDVSLIVSLEGVPGSPIDSSTRSLKINEMSLSFGATQRRLEWIELYNPGKAATRLSKFSLSDEQSKRSKWALPDIKVAPRSFVSLSAKDLGAGVLAGSTLFLNSADGETFVDAVRVPEDPTGFSRSGSHVLGRYPDASGPVDWLARPTRSTANQRELSSQVVINEIHYHGPASDPDDEYVELHNPTASPVALDGFRFSQGIAFSFAKGDSIPPGGFLLLAKNPTHLKKRSDLRGVVVKGPYTGSLSNRGEQLSLTNALGVHVDSVTYADSSPWSREADGFGSSLELVDATTDNALPGTWEPSDETTKSTWEKVEYELELNTFRSMPASSLQLILMEFGECLIDDLRVVRADGKVIVSDDFSKSDSRWRYFGTHGASERVESHALSDSPCLHLVSSGRGNSRHNYVSYTLSETLDEGTRFKIAFRVRRLRGSQFLLSRTSGQGLARTTRLSAPSLLGTPGRVNSRKRQSAPVVAAPQQHPILPGREDPVEFLVPLTSNQSIAGATLRYRHESSPQWGGVTLSRTATGRWRGVVPPQPRGRVEFYILATDSKGRTGSFPAAGKDRPALYGIGLDVSGDLPTYNVLVSESEWTRSRSRERMSNESMTASIVYGKSRILYDVGFRARGSGFTRGGGNWRVSLGAETFDGRQSLTFDAQGRDFAKMKERTTFWLLDQIDVPTPRQRYVQVNISGNRGESGIYEEVEKINGAFLARWFPKPKDREPVAGLLHKVDDYWDFRPTGSDSGFSRGFGRRSRNGSYVEAYMEYDTSDQEDYRWNFPPRANGHEEDFAPLVDLIRFVDPRVTSDADFLAQAESRIDGEEWMREIAGRTIANDWDTFGIGRGKNAFVYRAPTGIWHLLPWDSDLGWGGGFRGFQQGSIFPEKFPAARRIVEQPKYRKAFLEALSFLATKRLEEKFFASVIDELERQIGVSDYSLTGTARSNRARILREIPRIPFTATVIREGESLRIQGTAPYLARRILLDGRDLNAVFSDSEWNAKLDAKSRGKIKLRAVDRDGDVVSNVEASIPEAR